MNGVAVGTFFHWRNVTPFGIRDAHAYLLGPPPALTSNQYAKAYNEVITVGSLTSSERPQDRANVALYYAASSPTQVFNQAARQVAQERWHSLSENARALALINMAISDSLVASFYNKYHYNLWRPETAIRAGDTDGNPKTEADPTFLPFIVTPCFPSYPSNHGSASNGGAEVMRRLYGEAATQSRCRTLRCPISSCNIPALSKLPTTSPTRACMAESIFESTRSPVRAWAGLSVPPYTRTTCVPYTPRNDCKRRVQDPPLIPTTRW